MKVSLRLCKKGEAISSQRYRFALTFENWLVVYITLAKWREYFILICGQHALSFWSTFEVVSPALQRMTSPHDYPISVIPRTRGICQRILIYIYKYWLWFLRKAYLHILLPRMCWSFVGRNFRTRTKLLICSFSYISGVPRSCPHSQRAGFAGSNIARSSAKLRNTANVTLFCRKRNAHDHVTELFFEEKISFQRLQQ